MTEHEHGHISDSDAQEVYWENVRVNQIGGETDGISPKVAEDLGYLPPKSFEGTAVKSDEEAPVQPDNVVGINDEPAATVKGRQAAQQSRRHPTGRQLREMPSPEHGLNSGGPQTLPQARAEAQRGLSSEQIANQQRINNYNAKIARIALRDREK